MFGKKKIEAVSVLELRNYTPQALRKISSIQAVSTILLPENPSPAFAEAYADITKGAIAQEVFAPTTTGPLLPGRCAWLYRRTLTCRIGRIPSPW